MHNRFFRESIVVSQIFRVAFLFLVMFAFYIQFHGKVSPGGGFQSGIIMSILFIIYELLSYNIDHKPKQKISDDIFSLIACLGVLIYAITGFSCFLFNGYVFDYYVLSKSAVSGQQIGVFFIESGVGLGVFGSMMVIYRSLIKEALRLNSQKSD